ncbi:urea transporter [Paenibacillus shirakamiensis]|uniref:Urea transporter n=1 Tax=Paenibacillus shirakamiensis TaxID=1265935 RepID=A0ABS4JEE2_9BACL|nr:urea transporter [Paenibacillus shirakamiensis]MBP2000063.1 urea transporter [Paenibacillus shirakamiensis]
MQAKNRDSFRNGTFFSIISASLKGISQVILIDNAISGLIILIAIMISSTSLGIIVLLSALLASVIGRFGGTDRTIVNQGLLGYNSVLTGIALFLNLEGDLRWVIALAGSAVAVFFTAAMMHVMRNSKVPVLTFPYIVLTWFLLLASYRLGRFQLTPSLVPQDLSHWQLHPEGTLNLMHGLINGVGQVYFQDTIWSGILILIGVFWAGWKLGLYAIIGTALAWITAYSLGAEVTLLNLGLYGYNAVLTIIAVAAVFDTKSRLAPLTGIIAAVLTIPITASIDTWLLPFGLPTLTMPFVLCTWLFLAARKVIPKL